VQQAICRPALVVFFASNDIAVDTAANEVFVADGYGNRPVAVFDSETEAYKRHSGA
jgi:hypothetical protein